MKIICPKGNLFEGIQTVSKAVPSRTTMSILQCILIDATRDIITLTANDMEMGIETYVEGDIIEQGMIALDARIFSEIVRKLPENDVTISTDENCMASISCEKAVFNIIGKPGDDFAYLPDVEREDSLTLSQYSLKEAIRQTIFSISDNENSIMMTGELFDIHDDILKIASLDGHRISIRRIKLNNFYPDRKMVVPGKTLNEISKILSGEPDREVSIFFTKNTALFEFDRTTVVTRLIEGEYFKVDQMLSKDYETKVRVNKKEFADGIDRASTMIKEGDRKPVIMSITDDGMDIRINSTIGSMGDQINIEKEGKDLIIGFNPKFLLDALRAIDDETIDMYLMNPKSPCFIRDEDEKYIYLILPVNFTTVY